MFEVTGRVYPNGEFGLSKARKCKISVQRRRVRTRDEEWAIQCLRVHGLQESLSYKRKILHDGRDLSLQVAPLSAPLGSSLLANSHRAKRGSKGISRYSARMVRNAAYLLEKRYGKDRLSFLTYTLPSLSQEEWEVVCSKWSEIVRVVLQRLRRNLMRGGLPDFVVSVTELQEKRLKRDGVPGLHLHILFVGRKHRKAWMLSPQEVRSFWISAVEHSLGYSLECGAWRACENIQRVEKSASGYLGKYMTKGVKAIESLAVTCPAMCIPSSWSNLSSSLRLWVKREIVPIGQAMSDWILNLIECGNAAIVPFVGKIEFPLECGKKITLGFYGRLSPEAVKMIREEYRYVKASTVRTL